MGFPTRIGRGSGRAWNTKPQQLWSPGGARYQWATPRPLLSVPQVKWLPPCFGFLSPAVVFPFPHAPRAVTLLCTAGAKPGIGTVLRQKADRVERPPCTAAGPPLQPPPVWTPPLPCLGLVQPVPELCQPDRTVSSSPTSPCCPPQRSAPWVTSLTKKTCLILSQITSSADLGPGSQSLSHQVGPTSWAL